MIMSRKCTVCESEQREQIEGDLLRGWSLRNIAIKYRNSVSALHRHKRDHMLITDQDGNRVSWSLADLRDPAKSMAERAQLIDALLDRLLEPLWMPGGKAGKAVAIDWNAITRLLHLAQLDDLALLRMSGQLRMPDASANV